MEQEIYPKMIIFPDDGTDIEFPVPYPDDGKWYYWDDPTRTWKLYNIGDQNASS